jgi:hypothetical protein
MLGRDDRLGYYAYSGTQVLVLAGWYLVVFREIEPVPFARYRRMRAFWSCVCEERLDGVAGGACSREAAMRAASIEALGHWTRCMGELPI